VMMVERGLRLLKILAITDASRFALFPSSRN
jgi:hypothetical protein